MKGDKTTLLLIQSSPDDAARVRTALDKAGARRFRLKLTDYHPAGAAGPDLAGVDAVLLTVPPSGKPAFDVLSELRTRAPEVPVIALSSAADGDLAEEAVRLGAWDRLVSEELTGDLLARCIRHAIERRNLLDALRRRTEELARARARFHSIADRGVDGIIIVDSAGGVLFANPAAQALLGRTAGELSGEPFGFRLAEGEMLEVEIARPDGSRRVAELHAADVAWDETDAHFVTLHDITGRRRLEEQLRQSQKMEAMGQLAGGVAHDFNNVLSIIMGFSELILDRLGEQDGLRPDVEDIAATAERAGVLVRQLLTFSSKQELTPEILDLNGLVGDMRKMLLRIIGEEIELSADLAPGLAPVKADRGGLEQVVMNLVVNARDAMPKGGKIIIKTSNVIPGGGRASAHSDGPRAPRVLLSVSDTGCGMDEATRQRVFEPFFTTKSENGGTGLGLSTAYGIVKQSGGDIAALSEPGRGATFNIWLPAAAGAKKAVEQPATAPPLARGAETVLLVEDDESVRALEGRMLSEKGYTVLEAGSGPDALRVSEEHAGPIHLLVADVVMPGMNGKEVAEALAAGRPEMAALYISGYAHSIILDHGVSIDADAFVSKPFKPGALVQKVRQVLQTNAPAQA